VLLSDSGVGKSGLGLVLSGQKFAATEATHRRRVRTLDRHEVNLESGGRETRETLLWDLAGQPGYRWVHQLNLGEVAVALIVFDARTEDDSLAGVRHWDHALTQARRARGEAGACLKKFLVAGRTDRRGVGVNVARLQSLIKDMGFDGYFETSAKEGLNIVELRTAIHDGIDWNMMPKVSSSRRFRDIKWFLVEEIESGRLLQTIDDLARKFVALHQPDLQEPDFADQFLTCIGRIESSGSIRQLGFGNLVLLQPEMLDDYASAMVIAARAEPDGLGSISEEDARLGRFLPPECERVADQEHERLLVIATIQILLLHEIALREITSDGSHLVFPSQQAREHPDIPDPSWKQIAFTFEGPILTIYSTLAVRLSHSGLFRKDQMWRNAATYSAQAGGTCGIILYRLEGETCELSLFFDAVTTEETRVQFEEFIRAHLERRAIPGTIRRHRLFVCQICRTSVPRDLVRLRQERGFDWTWCHVCNEKISLLDSEAIGIAARLKRVPEMERHADTQRDRNAAASKLQGKILTSDFDVFLCHRSDDKPAVKIIGDQLKQLGILPWLDVEQLQPGLPWQPALEKQIKKIKSAAVFIGRKGLGPWQDLEQAAFLRQFVKRRCPVIPVILKDATRTARLPTFLEGMMWVDFRKLEPDPLKQLIWGITGNRSGTWH